jgi:hypothetical protein
VWLVAFMGGAGIEVLGNRIQGGVAGKDVIKAKLDELESKIVRLAGQRTAGAETGRSNTSE